MEAKRVSEGKESVIPPRPSWTQSKIMRWFGDAIVVDASNSAAVAVIKVVFISIVRE